jgi:hypothetical protein
MKVEEITNVEEEEEPVPITFPIIKTEHEVSCIYLYVHFSNIYRCLFLFLFPLWGMEFEECFKKC